MIDVIETIERWYSEGQRIALATVVGVERSAPRDPGAVLALNERGDVAGSVSGGCVEAEVYAEAQAIIGGGRARLLTYGISDSDAISAGLTCGGTIHVFVERLDPTLFERIRSAVRGERPAVLATCIDGYNAGAKLLVENDEVVSGFTGSGLDSAATLEARALLGRGEAAVLRTFGRDGEPLGVDVRVFFQVFAPKPKMYIFGAIDFSRAMARIGKYLGYFVEVIDARPVFATPARVPDADAVIVGWPDEYLRSAHVDERSAIIVLTHDAKFDIPLLLVALDTRAGYIGAMGSRRTHANRVTELRLAGVDEAKLGRICAPIGLDLGGRTPEETAISIAAEIIAVREQRRGGRLSVTDVPVHNARLLGAAQA